MKKKLTKAEKDQRRERRAAIREEKAAKTRELRAWFQDRQEAGRKRAALKEKVRRDAMVGKRGVDRRPDHLKATAWTKPNPEPVQAELGVSTLPDGRRIQANAKTRRAYGARGRKRKPRRRELTAHALGEMTKGERAILDAELAKAQKAGVTVTDRDIRARAWQIMADARHPRLPDPSRRSVSP